MSYVRLAGAVVLVLALLSGCWYIARLRERSGDLERLQKEFADYQAQATREATERQRQKEIDRDVIDLHLARIQKQNADLAAARTELRGVRLRVAATAVPTSCDPGPAAPGAHDQGGNGQPSVVAQPGAELDAEVIAERFAACDAVGARLNSLIDWTSRQAALQE